MFLLSLSYILLLLFKKRNKNTRMNTRMFHYESWSYGFPSFNRVTLPAWQMVGYGGETLRRKKSPIYSSETHTEQRGAEQNCHKERGKSLGDMQPSFHTPKTAVRKSWLLTGAGQGWWPTMHQLKEIPLPITLCKYMEEKEAFYGICFAALLRGRGTLVPRH